MGKFLIILTAMTLLLSGSIFAGCSDDDDDETVEETASLGTLEFVANGEDFVREGFVSKDGWDISFDHIYITLTDITACQTNPPFDPHESNEIIGTTEVKLPGNYTIDLAEGAEDAPPIFVGKAIDIKTGRYNALSWTMSKADSGPSAGHSLQMVGMATKNSEVKSFTINVDAVCKYNCGEYVGDVRKGFVSDDGTAEMEMTFHFDHLFGDAGIPADDDLNVAAPGFEFFLDNLAGQVIELDMAEMHLGHVGEGHCNCGCN